MGNLSPSLVNRLHLVPVDAGLPDSKVEMAMEISPSLVNRLHLVPVDASLPDSKVEKTMRVPTPLTGTEFLQISEMFWSSSACRLSVAVSRTALGDTLSMLWIPWHKHAKAESRSIGSSVLCGVVCVWQWSEAESWKVESQKETSWDDDWTEYHNTYVSLYHCVVFCCKLFSIGYCLAVYSHSCLLRHHQLIWVDCLESITLSPTSILSFYVIDVSKNIPLDTAATSLSLSRLPWYGIYISPLSISMLVFPAHVEYLYL